MIDREKVVTVLQKRFPGASAHDVAAAANAIVGLGVEYEPVIPPELRTFSCISAEGRYTLEDVATGLLRIYRRR